MPFQPERRYASSQGRLRWCLCAAAAAVALGCGDSATAPPGETAPGGFGGSGGGAGGEAGQGPSNRALVFEIDPVSTPEPIEVQLDWVGDDVGGSLTAAEDEAGVRRIQAFSCVDEGETNIAPGIGVQQICTLRQLANKEQDGSFVYDDWQQDAAGEFDPDNVHAEVNLYYHAQKIYQLVTSDEVGVFDRLPGRHERGGNKVPLTLVANYRNPSPSGLQPASVAFFTSYESLQMGMSKFMGLEGIEGDVIAFGQGSNGDFSYAGETVYHEFGHAVVNATAPTAFIYADEYGLTNLPWALNEGLANTFGFLGSGEPLLGEYLSSHYSGGFTFDARGADVFPSHISGHPVADGNPVFSANWEIYEQMLGSWGGSREAFTRVLLLALIELGASDTTGKGELTFEDYANAFVAAMVADGYAAHEQQARAIFEGRGLFAAERAKDIGGYQATHGEDLFMGCAANAPWNTVLNVDDGGTTVAISTAYVQTFVDMPAGATTITVKAQLFEQPGAMAPGNQWDYRLFVREATPVRYLLDGSVTAVEKDLTVAPVVDSGEAIWTLTNLTPTKRYYLHFVNYGSSEGVLAAIDCATG